MFGSSKHNKAKVNQGGGATTLISKSTEVVGNLVFSGSLIVEGKVCGNISAEDNQNATLQLLSGSEVAGEIRVPMIVINGKVHGDVHSSGHIELAAKAIVDGNVHYKLIEMVKGSQVNGNLVFCDKPAASSEMAANSAEKGVRDEPALKSVEPNPINA